MADFKKEDISIKTENKDNFKESIIERKNLTNEFTIASIDKHLLTLKKLKKEADATMSLARATKENIERSHAELIDSLSDKDRHHIYMWYDQYRQMEELAPQIADVDEEIETHQRYLDIIYEKFGYVKSEPGIKVEEGFAPKPKVIHAEDGKDS